MGVQHSLSSGNVAVQTIPLYGFSSIDILVLGFRGARVVSMSVSWVVVCS